MFSSLICFSLENMISSLITAMCLLTDNFMLEQYPNREILPSSQQSSTRDTLLIYTLDDVSSLKNMPFSLPITENIFILLVQDTPKPGSFGAAAELKTRNLGRMGKNEWVWESSVGTLEHN